VFKRKFYGFREGARYEMLYFPTYAMTKTAQCYTASSQRGALG